MICKHCHTRLAALHLTKTVNGVRTEVHLCEPCALDKSGVPGKDFGFSLYKFLTGFLKENEISESTVSAQIGSSGADEQCSFCGLTYTSFAKTGKLGCAHCYTHFEKRLSPMLKRLQGSSEHVGKLPRRNRNEVQIKRRVMELKALLMRLVAAEEYERASQVRDEIRQLEQGGKPV